MKLWPWARRADEAPAKVEPRLMPIVAARLPRQPGFARGYSAGQIDRLTQDWQGTILSGNADIRPSLRVLRGRARSLAINNDYARRYLRLLRNNAVGHSGIALQMRVRSTDGRLLDEENNKVEAGWLRWGKKGNCTVCGYYTWRRAVAMAVRTAARDGEVLIRLVRGWRNADRFAIQFVEADHLADDVNVPRGGGIGGYSLPKGHEIRMGVERDEWGRPVAYFLRAWHPGDDIQSGSGMKLQRIAAEEMIHAFRPERIGDARGVTEMASAMRRLNMLGGYEEAEVTAARTAASKMAFFTREEEGPPIEGDDKDAEGNMISDAEPGVLEELPAGMDVKVVDWQHPNSNYGPFMKTALRGAAAGMGASYNLLANDLEGVNFSSLRAGELDQRDDWRDWQSWAIEEICEPIFAAWLSMALLTQSVKLGTDRFDALIAGAIWAPRGWQWVDPVKEIEANERAVALGVKTRTEIAAEQGRDLEDTFAQLQREQEMAKRYGVDVSAKPKPPAAKPEPSDDDGDGDKKASSES
jgi:lambda family phage portal protein